MQMKKLLENFKGFVELEESANTIAADVNEILLGYLLAGEGGTFVNGNEAEETLAARAANLSAQQYEDQKGRAEAMRDSITAWADANGFDGSVQKVWWTARPGVLQQAVGEPRVSKGNPTDILIQFGDESFLGVSAKSTKGKADIGFKNPGVGSIGKSLGIDLNGVVKAAAQKEMEALGVDHLAAKERKVFIRANPVLRSRADEMGRIILNMLRDFLLSHLLTLDDEEVREHLVQNWLDADGIYPYYIKTTGHGSVNKGFGARVEDPIKSEKYKSLMSEDITMTPVGNDSIGVLAGGKRIMKMRFKYESQKLASSLKMSGDPWKDIQK
tara:strand:- start:321 stop:1304 length:984 start_codon:yes stop_codon:yes gene_type:complete